MALRFGPLVANSVLPVRFFVLALNLRTTSYGLFVFNFRGN